MRIPCGIRRVRVLLDIEIKNLKSFKNQTIFSMEAENKIEDRNSFEVEVGKEKFELLKTAVLFGGNASGKSNFTSVLSIFRYYLFNKGIEKYNKEGFRFGEEDKNSTIKVRNVVDDKIYEYILEINFNTKKIIKEKLYITALERKLVFERENNKIVKYDKEIFSEYEITIGFINETLTDSDSVISRIIEWRVPEEIEKYIFYIDKIKINNYSDDLGKYIYENKNNKKLVIEFLKKIGIIVNDIEVYREKNEFFLKNIRESKEFQILSEKEQEKLLFQIAYIYRIYFVYEDNQKQKYKLDYYEQSAGIQKILSMFFPIYNLLNNGGVMIIDELDITLHYSLIKEIIKMFNSVEYNRKNAQLIFTTHNLLLLDFNLFREDQIWFLENNDVSTGTELYSLSDIEGYEKKILVKRLFEWKFWWNT